MTPNHGGLVLIAISLLAALTVELLPLPNTIQPWQPPWLLLTVLFWALHRPGIIGMTSAWGAGLVYDAALGSPLGAHALLFCLIAALILAAQRLLLALPMIQQALWVSLLVLLHQFMALILEGGFSHGTPALLPHLASALITLLAWPLIHVLLLDKQRRLMG
ncbi:MAG: rod shape-determining protein MreD [Pseudomonadota bacterium]